MKRYILITFLLFFFFFFLSQVKVSKGIPGFRFSWYRVQFGSCRRRNHFSVSLYLAHSYSETVVIGVQCQCGICATRIGRPFLERHRVQRTLVIEIFIIKLFASNILEAKYFYFFSLFSPYLSNRNN